MAELDAVCRRSIFADGPGFGLPARTRLYVDVSPMSLGHRSLSNLVLRAAEDFRLEGNPTWRISAAQGFHITRPQPQAKPSLHGGSSSEPRAPEGAGR